MKITKQREEFFTSSTYVSSAFMKSKSNNSLFNMFFNKINDTYCIQYDIKL